MTDDWRARLRTDPDFQRLVALELRRRRKARGERPGGHVVRGVERRLAQGDRRLAALARQQRQERASKAMRRTPKATWPKCGARCRDGHACRAPIYWPSRWLAPSSRCKRHGGASTGPKTEEGRQKLAASMAARWAAWRAGTGPKPGRKTKAPAGG